MAHILIYGPRMAHGHEHQSAVHEMEKKLKHQEAESLHHHAPVGRKPSLTDKAKEVFHDVAEKTMELTQEVKEKMAGHVTDKDIANAAQKVADLRAQLANEQHELKKIQRAAEFAENNLNLHEYEALKEKEIEAKNDEREIEIEIAEAEGDYIRLQNAQLMLKLSHKNK